MKQKPLFPIFLSHGFEHHKILNESTYIEVADDDWNTGIMIRKQAKINITSMLNTGVQIDKQTFNDALLQALSHLNQLTFMAVTSEATDEDKRESCEINEPENVMI